MEINKSHQVKSVAFQGYQNKKTETGVRGYHMNCMYDSNRYDCEVQFFKVGFDDRNKEWFIERGPKNSMEPFFTIPMDKKGVLIDPEYDLELEDGQTVAYRFKLIDKENKTERFVNEDNREYDGCTLLTRNGTTVVNQGPMYLAMPDSFAPGYVFAGFNEKDTGTIKKLSKEDKNRIGADARKSTRTFANQMGGTMAGLVAKIPEIRRAGNKRLITTPLMGGDTVSAFKYWPENNMLTAGGLGTRNDWRTLQLEAFKWDMSTVDDGTFSSEGLQGIHFQRAIQHMDSEEKPDEYYMFRMTGINDDSLGLGVVPENFENLNAKLVNLPFDVVKMADGHYEFPKNKDYNPDKKSEIQIFDNSMVTDAQKNDKKHLIEKYDKKVANNNKLAINTHDDTAQPYHFVVDPYEIKRNFQSLNEVNKNREEKIDFHSPRGVMFIGSLSGLKIDKKTEGGFVCWNANTDMVKYNYFTSNYDNELLAEIKDPEERAIEMNNLRRGNCQVRDMATQVARYRTRSVRNLITEYTAKTIGELPNDYGKAYDKVTGLLNSQNPNKPILPESLRVDRDVFDAVYDNDYKLRPVKENYKENLISSMMDLPLDSIEFAPEVQGVLSSPYISKLSPDREHIGETRYNAMNDSTYKVPQKYAKTYNKMNDIFNGEMAAFADKVLKQVDKNSKEKLFTPNGELTEYGMRMIPFVGEDIARYAVTKSLMPNVGVKQIKGGEIAYDYETMRSEGTLEAMGVNGDSQLDEANQMVNRIKKGMTKLSNKDIDFVATSINRRFANTNANSLKMAEVMVYNSGLGLDWRYDAAKDVADFDAIRNGAQRFDTGWNNVIEFYKDMSRVINEENPNSYQVAELTDVGDIIRDHMPDDGSSVIYDNQDKAIGVLLNLAGITSEANYSYFFDGITKMFGYEFVSGDDKVGNDDDARVNLLEENIDRFAKNPIEYKRNSYTFASNHDKPRIIHCLSMDMSLYNANLNNVGDKNHRITAYKVMNDLMNDSDISQDGWNIINGDDRYFNNISSKSIANGELLRNSIGAINEKFKNDEKKAISESSMSEDEKQAKYRQVDEKYNTIYAALSQSIADVISGDYYKNLSPQERSNLEKKYIDRYNGNRRKTIEQVNMERDHNIPDDYKRVLEKDGFGTKSIPDAFDIVYDQAINMHNLNGVFDEKALQNYKNAVDSKATEVGRIKNRIITKFLTALSGNPTIYGGDELGMTGMEDKCENTYNQNRGQLDWTTVEQGSDNYREDVDKYRKSMTDITRVRMDDDLNKMEALNNGTLYKLDMQNARGGKKCSAVISQAANGAMNISVLNPNGISTDPKIDPIHLHPTDISLESIYLKGPAGKISLDTDITFKNINPEDKNDYKVYRYGDDYCIKVDNKDNGADVQLNSVTAPDGVMMLYYIPKDIEAQRQNLSKEKMEAFMKAEEARANAPKTREYYNQQYNIPQSDAYGNVNRQNHRNGENIDFTSKD